MDAGSLIAALCFGTVILSLVVWIAFNELQRRNIAKARDAYGASLRALTKDSGNTHLRQQTLSLGRKYAALAKGDKRTLFDEVALMNDLNAITPETKEPHTPKKQATSDAGDRLKELSKLKNEGLITEQEYEEKRKQVLDNM